ncbi:hypothetical protein DRE_06978 [Drechslerella stenobrocha 248]|uniref:rRNA methyltransferase 1, mitochondrial n=1 Tax=Drechslerella stenobrocha 248 TaxID=1043628 RepID=W7HW75_9PEZI|nr:hypothetical protein DRE_06978 [Drechslerella stenobrocha 248]
MYRGIAPNGLSRAPIAASRHLRAQLAACCIYQRQFSQTAAQLKGPRGSWVLRGNKKNREATLKKQKEAERMIKETPELKGRKWWTVEPPSPSPSESQPTKVPFRTGPPGFSFSEEAQPQSDEQEPKDSWSAQADEEPIYESLEDIPRDPPREFEETRTMNTGRGPSIYGTTGAGGSAASSMGFRRYDDEPRRSFQVNLTPTGEDSFSRRTRSDTLPPRIIEEPSRPRARLIRGHGPPRITSQSSSNQEWNAKWPNHSYSVRDGELESEDGGPLYTDSRYREQLTITRRPPRDLPKTTATSEFLYGHNICRLALKQRRRQAYVLHIYTGLMRVNANLEKEKRLRELAEKVGVSVQATSDVTLLDAMSKGRPHNGFVLEAEPLDIPVVTYLSEVDPKTGKFQAPILGSTGYVEIKNKRGTGNPFVLVLDELLDGGNFGAILRSAYYLGVDAVFICSKNSTPATAMTSRASAGALEAINLYNVQDMQRFVTESIARGWSMFGAMPQPSNRELKATKTKKSVKWLDAVSLGDPLTFTPAAVVMGNEADGLRPSLQKLMTHYVTVSKQEDVDEVVDSLNVGVAASIICNGFLRPSVKGQRPEPMRDQRTLRRLHDGKFDSIMANMMFQVQDGKYQAPTYHGGKTVGAGSVKSDGLVAAAADDNDDEDGGSASEDSDPSDDEDDSYGDDDYDDELLDESEQNVSTSKTVKQGAKIAKASLGTETDVGVNDSGELELDGESDDEALDFDDNEDLNDDDNEDFDGDDNDDEDNLDSDDEDDLEAEEEEKSPPQPNQRIHKLLDLRAADPAKNVESVAAILAEAQARKKERVIQKPLTKKQRKRDAKERKKVAKKARKEAKLAGIERRKKVREDATKILRDLNFKEDPRVLVIERRKHSGNDEETAAGKGGE